ncbi:MAG: SufD family Fe-S cluster assembly protein [Lachnospiraceae bacterium]|nr:SufD family Fe-S cluster assembly protein [Lachnospiraceae bacterium]
MESKRIVNHLPVLTWNKLDFNEAKMPVDAAFGQKSYRQEVQLPQGMKFAGELDRAAFADWSRAHGCENVPEAIVAGKFPMYAPEQFQTGMGAEIDELMDEAGVKTQLYEVEGKIEAPVKFTYDHFEDSAALESVLIHVKAGGELTLIQYFDGKEGTKGFVGSSTRVYLEEGARMHLIKVQMLPKAYVFFDDLGVKQQKDADFTFTQLELGAQKAYLGACFDQIGEASVLRADLGYIAMPESFLDYNYVDTFRGKKSVGVMRFHGVLFDHAQKVSRETLDFRQYCTDAEGDEEEDILVLGDDIVNKANPMILGEEEKVSGRHAVTIGKLSPEMLFYMQSRGIDEAKAQELMVRARIMEVAARIPDEEIYRQAGYYVDRAYCNRTDCNGLCK